MPDTVGGLPLHPLIVHATVVAAPTAALAVLLAALWPWFRRWAGLLPLGITVAAVVLYPITTSSGDALEKVVGADPQIERHSHLADGLLPWLVGLLVAAVAVTWLWWRERSAAGPLPMTAVAVVALLAVVTGAGTVQQVVRIGHSGAKSAWGDVGALGAGRTAPR